MWSGGYSTVSRNNWCQCAPWRKACQHLSRLLEIFQHTHVILEMSFHVPDMKAGQSSSSAVGAGCGRGPWARALPRPPIWRARWARAPISLAFLTCLLESGPCQKMDTWEPPNCKNEEITLVSHELWMCS